jgi:uncharacterized membrane protein (UPF0136 family)
MKTNTTFLWSLIVALIIGGLIGYFAVSGGSSMMSAGSNGIYNAPTAMMDQAQSPDKQIALYGAMRKLWSDHVLWTREYMIAAFEGSPSASADAARLMKNQEDIGQAIAVYYGEAAGTQLTALLKQHITIAVDLVSATKTNDQTKFKDANTRWQENADQIATLLSQANPNWTKVAVQDLMTMHLTTTADELTAISGKQYEKGITAFDAVFAHMMGMSDVLSAGIVKQFPDKF